MVMEVGKTDSSYGSGGTDSSGGSGELTVVIGVV